MTNYRFTKGNEANRIVLKAQKAVVTAATLTDDLAEIIMNTPGISHNVELIPGRVVEAKKKETSGGEVDLPQSIVSALIEAKIEEKPLKKQPEKKELPLHTSKPLTAKSTPKPKGKR